MKLRFMKSRIAGVSLGASLLLAAVAVQAADPVATEAGEIELLAAQLLKVTAVPSVRVHRGSHSETLRFGAASDAGVPKVTGPEVTGPEVTGPEITGLEIAGPEVVVHRGNTEPEAPEAVPIPAAVPEAQLRVSSGRELWLYDPEGETVRACRLFKSSRAGRFKIRCFERRLY